MEKELVFGHKAPDTDAMVASMAEAYLQNKLGKNTEAVALGAPNEETKFVLKHFDQKAPRIIKTAKNEVNNVILVDHNEPQQSVDDLKDLKVTNVVDHHRIANFNTAGPLSYRAEPVGSTSTILTKMFKENNVNISPKLAGLLLSAILSDTLILKSPTTTPEDKQAVEELAKIAHMDNYKDYGIKMLKAGTNVGDKSDQSIIDDDAKTFNIGGKKVRVSQTNVVDLKDLNHRLSSIKKTMQKEKINQNYDLFLLLITDILNNNSKLVVVGDPSNAVEEAFNKKLSDDNTMELPNVVSRKKQVVPPLSKTMDNK